jgi:N-acetylglucosamine-6-sulfatase
VLKAKGLEDSTYATAVQQVGYATAHIGKYINLYNELRIPPGWSEWYSWLGEVGEGSQSGKVNDNGTLVDVGDRNTTDLCSARAVKWITEQSSAGTPFLCQISPQAPRSPPEQAYRFRDRFQQLPLPKEPNFNENNTSDKPDWLRRYGKLDDHDILALANVHRDRTKSMLPVVDMLDAIIQRLRDLGEREKTFIFFYSDHGYHIGNHRTPRGKLAPYDEDFRIPFYARGPGVPAGVRRPELALNIDLAPTFAEITGATIAHEVDGRSLLPLGGAPAIVVPWRRRFLLEAHTEANMDPQVPTYQGMLTPDYLYTEYVTGEKEAYNISTDPKRLNRIARSKPVYDGLGASLAALRDCTGEACRTAEDS